MSTPLDVDINLKKQQSKTQKLLKSDDNQKNDNKQTKTKTHAKSYKRKARKSAQEGQPIKCIKIDVPSGSDDASNDSAQELGLKKNGQQSMIDKKRYFQQIKPLNPNFPLPVNKEEVYGYTILYSYTQKCKKLEVKGKDINFLDDMKGQALCLINNQRITNIKLYNNEEFEDAKQKIQMPFDQCHKKLAKKISQTFKQE